MFIDQENNVSKLQPGDKIIYFKKKGIVKFMRGCSLMPMDIPSHDSYEIRLHREGGPMLDLLALRGLYQVLSGFDLERICTNEDYEICKFK